jgi:hypothetical protein
MQMLQQILASMRYAHPSFVNKLNTLGTGYLNCLYAYKRKSASPVLNVLITTTDMQDSLILLTQFQNMMFCLMNVQLVRIYDQGMFIFGVTKNKFLPRTGTQLLCVMIWTLV